MRTIFAQLVASTNIDRVGERLSRSFLENYANALLGIRLLFTINMTRHARLLVSSKTTELSLITRTLANGFYSQMRTFTTDYRCKTMGASASQASR
jgi:hypothetical protein